MYNVEVIREGGRGDQSMKWFLFEQNKKAATAKRKTKAK